MAKMNQEQKKDGGPGDQTDGQNKRKKKVGNRAGFMYAAALFLIFSVLGIAGSFLFQGRSRMQVSVVREAAGGMAESAEGRDCLLYTSRASEASGWNCCAGRRYEAAWPYFLRHTAFPGR